MYMYLSHQCTCQISRSKGEIFLLKGESRTVLGVKLREPPPVFEDELVFPDQERLDGISLVVPCYHVSLQL